jgi:hypothetical protein
MPRKLTGLSMALVMFAACAWASLTPAWGQEKLTGTAAWSQLVGNSISGEEDGKPLVEYYAPDGTTKSMHGNEISTGNGRSSAR